MSEIRYDRLTDTHVIIAPERLHRPIYEKDEVKNTKIEKSCAFCEGNEKFTPPEIYALRTKQSFKNEEGWKTRVVPNLYKAVQIEAAYQQHHGMFEHWDGFGAHEVVIDTAEHYTSMTQMSEENIIDWFKTLALRVKDLRNDNRIASLSLFKNEGIEAGATQSHCHTQIIGLPIVSKTKNEEYHRLYEHYKHNHNSLIELLVEEEKAEEKRVVASNSLFTAFCPYASSHPFEIMISSTKALGDINSLNENSIKELSSLLLLVLKKLKKQLNNLNFNLILSTPPLHNNTFSEDLLNSMYEANRFYIKIIPRIYKYGGFEEETGILINPLEPELAAKLLKESTNV